MDDESQDSETTPPMQKRSDSKSNFFDDSQQMSSTMGSYQSQTNNSASPPSSRQAPNYPSRSPQRGRRAERERQQIIDRSAPVATPEDSVLTPPRSLLNSPGMDRVSHVMRNTSVPNRVVDSTVSHDNTKESNPRSHSEPRHKRGDNQPGYSGNTYTPASYNPSNPYRPKFNPSHKPPLSPQRPSTRFSQKSNGYTSRSEEMLDTYGQDSYRPSDSYNNSKQMLYNSGDYRGRSHDSLSTNRYTAQSRSASTLPPHAQGLYDDELGGTRRPLSFVKALEMSEMVGQNSNVPKQNRAMTKSRTLSPSEIRQPSASSRTSNHGSDMRQSHHSSHSRSNARTDKKKGGYDTFEVAV